MNNLKKFTRTVGIPAVAAVAVLAGSSAAFAASSYNVTAGSAPAGTVVNYTATTTGALPQVTFTDTTAGTVLNCESASAPGTVTVGTLLSGTGIGTINGPGTIWNNCTGPFGLQLTVTGSGTWGLDATGDTAGGVTDGTVTAVNAHVSDNGGGCDFDVKGTVDGTYANGASNGTLDLPGTASTLTISNVSGFSCGLVNIQEGDQASFKATYQVVADNGAYNPIQITSNP